ncbi:TPR Domain containing protein [Trichomonas vaginalis G3]|uniref:TPR Domain containing protein n=1 Tax=Trichomonas vaginalis (strain ATCC PRA-98 / G3) TaxID=412133 RepID=A2EPZ5_TRIV3|nr:tetratricopeptide repeat protein 21-like protein family [Trichomonas vaginalis G3]EAY05260.1 TPR Domain containing protein [Trichomonas vaginalis G3]KAI5530455.1 tetratricopeptide repeat protein 21-like protein family [Trichomonas vaginalis G3]|eukprot:XP_001317483.1 TPR Domain containing protein [Trichomonas vaginalis G3]
MSCLQERVFYYWRHGFFGHVVALCEKMQQTNQNDLFIAMWATLATHIQKPTINSLDSIKVLDCRQDLELLYLVNQYVITKTSPDQKSESYQLLKYECEQKISQANTFSRLSSIFIALIFHEFDLCEEIIGDSTEPEFIAYKGWLSFFRDKIQESLDYFNSALEKLKGPNCMTYYGKALASYYLDKFADSAEYFYKIESTYQFPEIVLEQIRCTLFTTNYEALLKHINRSRGTTISNLECNIYKVIYSITIDAKFEFALRKIDRVIKQMHIYERFNWKLQNAICFLFYSVSCRNSLIASRLLPLVTFTADTHPGIALPLFILGHFQIATGNYFSAINSINKGLFLDPISSFGIEAQLRITVDSNRFSEVRDQIDFLPDDLDFSIDALKMYALKKVNNVDMDFDLLLEKILQKNENFKNGKSVFANDLESIVENAFDKYIAFRFDSVTDVFIELVIKNYGKGYSDKISKVIKLVPGLSPFKYVFLVSLVQDEKYEKAIDLARYIMISDWQYKKEWCLSYAAIAYIQTDQMKFAQKCIKESIAYKPTIAQTPHFNLIWLKCEVAKGNGHNAAMKVSDLFERQSEGIDLHFLLDFVDICLKIGEYNIAAKITKLCISKIIKGRDKVEVLLRQSYVFASKQMYDKAFAQLEKLEGHEKYAEKALLCKADIYYYYMKDEGQYIKLFEELCKKNPTTRNYSLLGNAYSKLLLFDKAAEAYEFVLKEDQSIAPTYIKTLFNAHRYEKAIENYKKTSSTTFKDTLFFVKLLIRMKRYKQALQCLESANSLKDKMQLLAAEYHELIGFTAMKCSEFEKSELSYIKALAIYKAFIPKNIHNCFVNAVNEMASKAAFYLGKVISLQGRDEEAINFYNDSLEIWPMNSDAVMELFKFYRSRNNYQKCLSIVSDHIMKNTDRENIALLVTSLDIREYDELINCLRTVLQEHPNYSRAAIRLIEICARAGKLDLAKPFVNFQNTSSNFIFVQGLYLMHSGDTDGSLKLMTKIFASRMWGLSAKLVAFQILTNPKCRYIWMTKEKLSTDENLEKAKSLIQTMDIDAYEKQLLNADVLCARNDEKSVAEAYTIYSAISESNSENPLLQISLAATIGCARCGMRQQKVDIALKHVYNLVQSPITHETHSFFVEAYLIRATVMSQSGTYLSAKHDSSLALSINKSSFAAWELSATFNQKIKMYNEAANAYGMCWELTDRKDLEMAYNLAVCLMRSGREQEALHVCRCILDINPMYRDVKSNILVNAYKKLTQKA